MKLYTFHQSGSSYRVRIALNLKHIAYEPIFVRGGRDSLELRSPGYLRVNPQGVVPVLVDGDRVLTQSLAIIEYLEEICPSPPLLPVPAAERARVRALAQLVASDIQPLIAARVVDYIAAELGPSPEQEQQWQRHWIVRGLQTVERQIADHPDTGLYCHGNQPTLADLCLVPQVHTAQRLGCDLAGLPAIERVTSQCLAHPAFRLAAPENQPDARAS